MTDDLLTLLKNVPADLDANRAGRYGAQQLAVRAHDTTRAVITTSVFGVSLGLLGMFVADGRGSWGVIISVAWLAELVGGIFLYADRSRAHAEVRCLTGRVTPSRGVSYNGTGPAMTRNVTLLLSVGGTACRAPSAQTTDLDRWQALLGDRDYRVYVTGDAKRPIVLGVEPA